MNWTETVFWNKLSYLACCCQYVVNKLINDDPSPILFNPFPCSWPGGNESGLSRVQILLHHHLWRVQILFHHHLWRVQILLHHHLCPVHGFPASCAWSTSVVCKVKNQYFDKLELQVFPHSCPADCVPCWLHRQSVSTHSHDQLGLYWLPPLQTGHHPTLLNRLNAKNPFASIAFKDML